MLNQNVDKINKIKYYLLILFVVIQPLLDTYYLYTDEVVNLIGFSPSTIIRIGITAVLVLLTLITLKDKKAWMIGGGYIVIVAIYSIFHFMNAKDFYSLVPGNFNYSITGEIFYIVRMMIPLSIIFVTVNTKISTKDFEKAVKLILILIAGSIVFTNIFKVSLSSYTNEVIKDNIFGWFGDAYANHNYSSLASKGVFNFANQIAGLLVLLLPIMLVIATYNRTIVNVIIIVLTITAMVMLGTKVALFGAIIDVVVYILALIFMTIFRKDKLFNKKVFAILGVIMLVLAVLVPKAPALNRELVAKYVRINNSKVERQEVEKEETTEEKTNEESAKEENVEHIDPKTDIKPQEEEKDDIEKEYKDIQQKEESNIQQPDKDDKELMIEYIEKNYQNLMISEHFITKSYPYQYDPEFWVEIINLPVVDRLDWRSIEQKMLQRVMDINDNPNDKLFGISFTRTQNIFNLERDFVSQYYSMGILGVVVLLGPYVILTIGCFIKMLANFKKKFNLRNSISCFGIVFILGVSLYSGNVMDALTVTIILSFILGKLIDDVWINQQ